MKSYIKYIVPAAAIALTLGMTSCTKDLDVDPINPNLSLDFEPEALYNQCFANIAMAGNGGANGDCDIDGLDGGTTGFIRQMWNTNELTTDEAICSWGDAGIQQFDYNTYDASHPMINGYYARLTTGISYCNQYINEAGGYNETMTAEIRLCRALHYYLLMDAFGNIPFTTSLTNPERLTRQEAYEWLEKELLEIEPMLTEAKAKKSSDPAYGRPDKASAWMLLMRLYFNAEVYTGSQQWAKAAEYAQKIITSSGRQLNTQGSSIGWTAYQKLFMGDNGESSAAEECILPILCDGKKTTSWGTSLYLIAGGWDEDIHGHLYPQTEADKNALNGTSEKWKGQRARPDLLKKFFPSGNAPHVGTKEMMKEANDDRALFYGVDREIDMPNGYNDPYNYGYAVTKFLNFHSDGSPVSDGQFPDTDLFFFRLAEAYLTYAEATARSNNNVATAKGIEYINAIRSRAHATTKTGYSMDDILDEWSREFYWEGRRRVDLIRHGKFGGANGYKWTWKGGAYTSRDFAAEKNIFPIPAEQVKGAITQNPGY